LPEEKKGGKQASSIVKVVSVRKGKVGTKRKEKKGGNSAQAAAEKEGSEKIGEKEKERMQHELNRGKGKRRKKEQRGGI